MSDRAVCESWVRVCSASRFAASSLVSATEQVGAFGQGVDHVLGEVLRFCTTERLAPKVEACERSVSVAALSSSIAARCSLFARKLPAAPLTPRPRAVEVRAVDGELARAVLVERDLQESPLSRFTPL